MTAATSRPRPQALANWLFAVAALVLAIVTVGGITRLTESGLSITEWKPVTGIVPPLTEAQWQVEFAKYQQIPEYQQLNQGMSLAAFKAIFFWEYLHRLIGRLIGLAFALPLAWFWLRGAIPTGYKPRLLALLALGGLQGAIGWWMVTSGLSVRTDVSHIRLAVHLSVALVTLGGLVWTARDLTGLARDPTSQPARLTALGTGVLAVLAIQIVYGAFVAGLNAGLVTDQWPLMNGSLYPGPTITGRSFGDAIINDPAIVHFIHRWWAWVTVAALIVLARAVRSHDRRASIAVHSAFGVQILLGITTVWSGMNIVLATLHQLVGALVVAASVWATHRLGQRRV